MSSAHTTSQKPSTSISLANPSTPQPTPRATVTALPPPEPPPLCLTTNFPDGSLAHALIHPPLQRPPHVLWRAETDSSVHDPSVASVSRVSNLPRVCGINSNDATSVKIAPHASGPLIDGGSNICVTGDYTLLVDCVNIPPVAISVDLEGGPASYDDTITKRGLLPLILSDGTMYFQPCYFCAYMVETIISPAAVLASSDQLYYWTQVGCKDPATPGSLQFTSRDGRILLLFDLKFRGGLYYCTSGVYTFNINPLCPKYN